MQTPKYQHALNSIAILTLIVSIFWLIIQPSPEPLALVLGSIAGILSLHTTKNKRLKSPPFMPRFVAETRKYAETNVVIWGPIASGKSWLIKAFARTLSTEYKGEIDGFKYDFYSAHQIVDAYAPPPTAGTSDFTFRFERRPTSSSSRHKLSSFRHNINIIDMQGSFSIGMVGSNPYFRKENDVMLFAHADLVLILLDHTMLDQTALYDPTAPHHWTKFTKSRYAEMIETLFSVLEKANPSHQRHYAVCFVKADLVPSAWSLDPDALIELFFGKEMSFVLNNQDQSRLNTFAVSSIGFLPGSSSLNFHHGEGHIIDFKGWKPVCVEFPFFWGFETTERKLLLDEHKSSKLRYLLSVRKVKNYVPYPKAVIKTNANPS